MLKIRSEQIRAFQPNAEEAFTNRVTQYLKQNHADTTVRLPKEEGKIEQIPETTLRELVRGGISRARKYEINWKSSLISFVVLMFLAAPNFDEHAKAAEVLSDEKIEANKRLEQLMKEMTDADWAEVEKNYDSKIWNLPVEVEIV